MPSDARAFRHARLCRYVDPGLTPQDPCIDLLASRCITLSEVAVASGCRPTEKWQRWPARLRAGLPGHPRGNGQAQQSATLSQPDVAICPMSALILDRRLQSCGPESIATRLILAAIAIKMMSPNPHPLVDSFAVAFRRTCGGEFPILSLDHFADLPPVEFHSPAAVRRAARGFMSRNDPHGRVLFRLAELLLVQYDTCVLRHYPDSSPSAIAVSVPEDARDAAIARARLEEISANPSLLIQGEALQHQAFK